MSRERLRAPLLNGRDSHYACVPRVIAADQRNHDLAPDECLVLGVLIAGALVAEQEDKFAAAKRAGKQRIDRVRARVRNHNKVWEKRNIATKNGQTPPPTPSRVVDFNFGVPKLSFKLGNVAKRTQRAGKKGFAAGMVEARKAPRSHGVLFMITRRSLLLRAHLATSGQHFRRLEVILDRLSRKIDGIDLPPPITIIDRTATLLDIRVSPQWLMPPYVRVALPWPMRSSSAATLLLVIHCLPISLADQGHIGICELGERIGLVTSRAQMRRALSRAVQVVNQRRRLISSETQENCNAAKIGVRAYVLDFIDKKSVRIKFHERDWMPSRPRTKAPSATRTIERIREAIIPDDYDDEAERLKNKVSKQEWAKGLQHAE